MGVTMASPSGIRVAVKISDELRKKVVAAVAAKNRKASKNNPVKKLEKDIVVSDDEFDGMINDKEKRKSLGEKLGFTPEKKETKPKKEKSAPGSATSSVKGSPTKKGGKKKNPWETDSDESEDDENGVVSDSADGASDFADDPGRPQSP